MRLTRWILPAAVAASMVALAVPEAGAQDMQGRSARAETVRPVPASGLSSQTRRRPATRLRVDRLNLPPNAVRTCDAWYVQEFRPSGPVIVPRMRCRWIAG